jgi:hypothetical protein
MFNRSEQRPPLGAKSPIMDNMPETQKDVKLAALFLQHIAALGMPVGVVVLTYENGLNT